MRTVKRILLCVVLGAMFSIIGAWSQSCYGKDSSPAQFESGRRLEQLGRTLLGDSAVMEPQFGFTWRSFAQTDYAMTMTDADGSINLLVIGQFGWPLRCLQSAYCSENFAGTAARDVYLGLVAFDSPRLGSWAILGRSEFPLRVVPVGMCLNTAMYSAGLWLSVIVTSRLRMHLVASKGRCPQCRYDLRGDLERGCPECGWNRPPNADSEAVSEVARQPAESP